jgi:nicotinamidase-related amidase
MTMPAHGSGGGGPHAFRDEVFDWRGAVAVPRRIGDSWEPRRGDRDWLTIPQRLAPLEAPALIRPRPNPSQLPDESAPSPLPESRPKPALAAPRIDPRHTAVLTVECHRGHLDLAVATLPLRPQAAASLVTCTAQLLRLARRSGMGVVHVVGSNRILPRGQPETLSNPFWAAMEEAHLSLIPDRETWISRHNLTGTVQNQLMPELGPEPGDVVIDRKRRLSPFRDTDLELTLAEMGVDTLVVSGLSTNADVLCCAMEAFNRDLRAIVVRECVNSIYGEELHQAGLSIVERCLGWVLSLDELTAAVEASRGSNPTEI